MGQLKEMLANGFRLMRQGIYLRNREGE